MEELGNNKLDLSRLGIARVYPFIYDGITFEEYNKEYEYYWKNYDKVKNGTYKPLWQQK